MTNPKAVTHKIVEAKVGDLWVDPTVQRSLRKARVTAIANEFDPDALGVITTSFRSPKRIHIIDGMHRYRAAELANYAGTLQTLQYQGLSIPQEAALFRKLNNTEKVGLIDQFHIDCVAENPEALELARFLQKHGWSVGVSAVEGRLSAVGALRRVYRLSPEAADHTLAVLTAAYGHRPETVQGTLIAGVGRMLAKYGRDVKLNELVQRLQKVPGGANGLVGNARGQSITRTGDLSGQVARVVTNLYNKGRRSSAIAAWS
jgi:uncharacterized protein DUF6551